MMQIEDTIVLVRVYRACLLCFAGRYDRHHFFSSFGRGRFIGQRTDDKGRLSSWEEGRATLKI